MSILLVRFWWTLDFKVLSTFQKEFFLIFENFALITLLALLCLFFMSHFHALKFCTISSNWHILFFNILLWIRFIKWLALCATQSSYKRSKLNFIIICIITFNRCKNEQTEIMTFGIFRTFYTKQSFVHISDCKATIAFKKNVPRKTALDQLKNKL